ncbi:MULTISPECIES: EF-P 5-aminopentanol modification-associated protein YfmH [Aneurinibacillus]|uniref:Insulinase family protein n=1 Tax=Aneurinibacillus thermoaerophilus TaxID=143495 RepID=A0ABX8YDW7_ANETH|nr:MULTISPECIES: pitrilysin family protein [Aneurinibacillus]AMA73518.1 zinc protease [Aneurinibacillus sp. XH2]MED0680035.1 pitrilysin family protein [Aneurinibacillus thermoaerophilus]MED0738448.1 pitrilysin family protein [Aneurinibacillus thermoaerophilus]MED0756090.1 pitrilysin family protein [Aneurinibacillus thermoaerophilus]MED0762310.1 pitrilysin family protein [Aneurinibacillus thermoaerophilus]
MKTRHYDRLNETIYYDRLDNGLEVYILPKQGFSKTYATFTTRYGSIDNEFRVPGKERVKVPDGIAHFLEHKMFEEKEGDVFTEFAAHGASANAFTSFDRTAYLFSSTQDVSHNVETLLNFVQSPYFTDQSVEKEKGIIGQEIRMYDDDPDWRVYFGLISNYYHDHPVKIDIAGTVESISKITKEMLYECYETFYHPSNMLLFIVGAVNPEEIMELVRQNQAQKTYGQQPPIERFYPEEPEGVAKKRSVVHLPVGIAKCLFGFKDKRAGLEGEALLKREVATEILLDVLFSPSSDLYQKLYEQGLINSGFGADYSGETQYGFSIIGGDTKDPDALVSIVESELNDALARGIAEESFILSKKKKTGEFLRALNSVEFIANSFTKYRFAGTDLFARADMLETMTLDDVNARFREHIDFEQFSVSIVTSPEKQ